MPYDANDDLPKPVREALPAGAQSVWRKAYNAAAADGGDEQKCARIAWAAVRNAGYTKTADGWVRKAGSFQVVKIDTNHRMAFGYANVSIKSDGEVLIDLHDETAPPYDLEHAAYGYVEESREAGEMHEGGTTGHLVESFMLTPEKLDAMGLVAKDGAPVPEVAWWVGFRFAPESFAKVLSGEHKMFSIYGEADKVEAE